MVYALLRSIKHIKILNSKFHLAFQITKVQQLQGIICWNQAWILYFLWCLACSHGFDTGSALFSLMFFFFGSVFFSTFAFFLSLFFSYAYNAHKAMSFCVQYFQNNPGWHKQISSCSRSQMHEFPPPFQSKAFRKLLYPVKKYLDKNKSEFSQVSVLPIR